MAGSFSLLLMIFATDAASGVSATKWKGMILISGSIEQYYHLLSPSCIDLVIRSSERLYRRHFLSILQNCGLGRSGEIVNE
jgi:hypothetical protein